MIVIQANEIPWELLDWAGLKGLTPSIDRFRAEGSVSTTEPSEASTRYLYPSQTWATFSTGTGFSEHGSYWYHDTPADVGRLFWNRAMTAGQTVGLAGVLHSARGTVKDPKLRFFLPDSFSDETPIPKGLARFHRANRSLTNRSGRKASARVPVGDLVGLATSAQHGLRPRSALHLGEIAGSAALGRRSFERARIGQHLIMSDIFMRQLKSEEPQLAVYFTNHVASMMHRYWFAAFPEQFENKLFDPDWCVQGADALAESVVELDRLVGRVMTFAGQTGRPVILASSMGQQANRTMAVASEWTVLLRDADQLSRVLGLDPSAIRAAMVPQITWNMATAAEADRLLGALLDSTHDHHALEFESNRSTLTLTYRLGGFSELPFGTGVPLDQAGFVAEAVEDAGTGIHHPDGIFGVWNASVDLPERMVLETCADQILSILAPETFQVGSSA